MLLATVGGLMWPAITRIPYIAGRPVLMFGLLSALVARIGRARPHAPVACSPCQPLGWVLDSGRLSGSGGHWVHRQLACVRGLAHSLNELGRP